MFGAKKRLRKMIEDSFGKNPLEGISYYNAQNRLDNIKRFHNEISARDESKWKVDDITWNDLEMDQVFLRVNHTNSFIGEQTLYHNMHILSMGIEPEKSQKLEKGLGYYDKNPEFRIDAEVHLNDIGKFDEGYYLAEFLLNSNLWKVGNTAIYHLLQFLLVLFFTMSVLGDSIYAVIGLVLTALTNLCIYLFSKQKYEIYFSSLMEFKKVYDFAKWMDSRDKEGVFISEDIGDTVHRLNKMSRIIIGMNERRRSSMTGDAIAILADYLWGIFLIDVSMFNHIMKVIADKQDDVLKLINYVGQVDADISILSYRKSLSEWCTPEFVNDGISVKSIAHPLIAHSVTNDLELRHRAIITGSNASGKSTFMKSVAINCILAQTIFTCLAKRMQFRPVIVVSCMALRDDVLTGESYYYREAKCLKRILDLVAKEEAVMVVIDEILKGTNTSERVAASKAILEYIGKLKCITLVATHDNELAESCLYRNYYFCSRIEENDIVFDYRIREGICTQTNAIALLSYLGYPKTIIERAKVNLDENRRNC